VSLSAGSKLGPYEIISPAGAGGMGEVYKAKDTRLDRIVAIKILPSHSADNPDLRQRFEREAKAISSLNHPNICTLYDIGQQNGADYLVMEFIDGETLATRLQQGPLSIADLLRFATQIADALDKAHRQGLVHRDLKPGNVMLTKEGAKLMDFGLARLLPTSGIVEGVSGITRTTPLTGEGTILGTLQYMAPEQLEGKEADARSDLFAFGAVLYEMATGKRAFDGKSQASLIASILKEEPRPVSQLLPMSPPMLDRVIKQCLEKDPDHRWQSSGDLKRALQWVSEGGSQVGIPIPVSARRRLREKVLWGLTIGLAVCATASTVLYLRLATRQVGVVRSHLVASPTTEVARIGLGPDIALSPDGNQVAFVARDSAKNAPTLRVRPLNSLTALEMPGSEGASYPFWSPDSRFVAYFGNGKLKKVLAAGGPSQTLCEAPAGRGGTWNHDDIILFSPDWVDLLYKVPAGGGKPVQVTVRDSAHNDFTHRWPFFLPDGDHFLFFCRTNGDAGGEEDAICMGSLNSPKVERLFYARSNIEYANGYLLFIQDGVLMARRFDPGSRKLLGDAFPLAEQVAELKSLSQGVFSASTTGNLVYFSGDVRQGSQLLILDRNGTELDTLGESVRQYKPKASPDQNFVAVDQEDANTANTDIWLYDIARNIHTRLTFDSAMDLSPVWSPDGQRIAFSSGRYNRTGLYSISISGSDTAKLLCSTPVLPDVHSWSSDGKIILFSYASSGSTDIWSVLVSDTASATPYLSSKFSEYDPYISPDGRWVAYVSDETGTEQVYVAAFPKPSGKWQISVKDGDRPRWSKDGRQLYFLDNDDYIWVVTVDGTGTSFKPGKPERLLHIDAARPGQIYDVFADNKRFVVNTAPTQRNSNSYVLIQNWPEVLKK
jgi:Tol biopolymer transport system component